MLTGSKPYRLKRETDAEWEEATSLLGTAIVLHLFRRRSDRVVEFPAVQMLPEAPVHQQERRRLRDLLLLALTWIMKLKAMAMPVITSILEPYLLK